MDDKNFIELKDTISGMTSADYKERFKAEYWQLKIRYNKLIIMLEKYTRGELGFKPKTPINILTEQSNIMYLYIKALEQRANIEDVNLE